jgi:5-methylcytosine-specific restriction endonuclease McrA
MKFEVRARVRWKVNSNTTEQELRDKSFRDIVKVFQDCNLPKLDVSVSVIRIKDPNETIKIKSFHWDHIVEEIRRTKNNFRCSHNGVDYVAKMNSQRYFLFRENNRCVCCGIVGNKVYLEKSPNDVSPHFNLYGERDNQLILLTKDHIKPKSLGGKDKHSNYQTMCSICNSLKGHANISVHNLSKLRSIYDKNRGADKRHLHDIIENNKARMSSKKRQPTRKRSVKFNRNDKKTVCDISVYRLNDGSLVGMSIYEDQGKDMKYIGNVRRGTSVRLLSSRRRMSECQSSGGPPVWYNKSLLRK